MRKLNVIVSSILLSMCLTVNAADTSVKLDRLTTEYTNTPMGIDVTVPRFSWQMKTSGDVRGDKQKAYQIKVVNEQNEEMWNSGRVESDVSLTVNYAGKPLQPTSRYRWTVTVWNQDDIKLMSSSWFETGLMSSDNAYANWSGAKWIGGDDDSRTFYSHYLPVFKMNCSIQLDKKSKTTRAAFIYGANDERLMDSNKNLYHLANKQNESYIKVELDISPLLNGKEATLNVYRFGYKPTDKEDSVFKSIPIPLTLINKENRYAQHTVSLSSNLGYTQFYIDNNEKEIGNMDLNPLGRGGDFIAFPMVGDVGYSVSKGCSATFSKLEIVNFRSPSNTIVTVQDKDLSVTGGKTGYISILTPKGNGAPMLRTVFETLPKAIQKARLYITSRGIYDAYVNGKAVTNDYLDPGLTQYNKTHMYQTFDVTDYIHSGNNAIGAVMSEGWWSGGMTFTGENWNFFGDRQSLLAKLVVTYRDGTETTVVTNPATWQCFTNGPVAYGSLFQGEVYDATKDALVEGWATPSYDASAWKPACEVALKGNISTIGNYKMPKVDDYSNFTLTGQFGRTIKPIKQLTAQSVEEVRPGVFVYDMGQNMAGVPSINFNGMKPGTKITMRFAEVKYPDLPEYKDNTGMIMLENIRAAMAQDIYIAKGGEETFSPRFTYHGYRFVEITGIDKALPVDDVKGIVISTIHKRMSDYKTSNDKVNKLWNNITWSAYANFMSIPTDCPQRNERLGWAGDISVFSRTATYLGDVPRFLRRYLHSMRDVQSEDGRFPDIAPVGGGFGGMLWGSAGITIPWESYQQYGDKVLLNEHYDAMKRYISYIFDKAIDPKTNLIVQTKSWGDLGDWLGLEDGKNDKSLIWESYFIYDLQLVAKMATALGKTDDAQHYQQLCNDRKTLFRNTYIQPETGRTIYSAFAPNKKGTLVNTQTSYVLPLAFDIVDGENKTLFVRNLIDAMSKDSRTDKGKVCPPYSLMTGFIGTAWISKALSDNGYSSVAYKLLQQTSYPSWLYSVEQGATTIWERVNSYTKADGFGGNNRMNSFNHYSFGAVGAWMFDHSLGIQRDENTPAFKHFILKPEPDVNGTMTYAKGYYDSMYGRIKSSWSISGNEVNYSFSIPANTSATLYLPSTSLKQVKESGKSCKKSKGVKYIDAKDGYVILELQSGNYEFNSLLNR